MPKRKHDCDDNHHHRRKSRRKHKKSKRPKQRRNRRSPSSSSISSDTSRYSRQSSQTYEGDKHQEYRAVFSESPVDDVFLDNDNTSVLSMNVEATAPSSNQPPAEIALQPLLDQPEAPPSTTAITENETNINAELVPALDPAILEILGEDPSSKSEFGKEINAELANRLEYVATCGLNNATRKELLEKYIIPINCVRVGAPQMNPEIWAALPEITQKRDKSIQTRQKQITPAISCLGQIITSIMQQKERDTELLKGLMDTIRILCDVQHTDSVRRRYFAFSSLKKEINDQLTPTKIDKFLFGENLADTLKAAKALSKSRAEIKVDTYYPKNARIPGQPQPPTSRNLNWRVPAPARRQPGPAPQTQRRRPPAPPRKPESSSRPLQRQFKRTRHY